MAHLLVSFDVLGAPNGFEGIRNRY